jgi:tRNA-2-methylthio-N6-dimethylallyladenosine synthase
MNKSVYIETFGCQMNVADTERAQSRLREAGYTLTDSESKADVVIFNTCSVRAKAEQKVFSRIGEVRGEQIVAVMGCVAQLEGKSIFSQAPVDLVVGTRATDRLPVLIERALNGERRVLDLDERGPEDEWNVSHLERQSPYIAFIPIIEGCNKFCSFCIVPYSRGREKSRAASEIIDEVLRLRGLGYKEINLIGQNVNSYRPRVENGLEGFGGATPFSRLLRAVASTGIERIKFTTSFPRDFHPDIVQAMEENENLCNYVHLPVQSGSDRILRLMRRGHRVEDYMERIRVIKSSRRGHALTTDIIVGFPGETEEDFEETLKLVSECEYDGMYMFKYSPRKGTPAASLEDVVSEEEKTERFVRLHNLQKQIQQKVYERYVGTTVSVLVEGESVKSASELTGHSTCNKVLNFAGGRELIGKIVSLRVLEAKSNSLRGELI